MFSEHTDNSKTDSLRQLNPQQQKAVRETEGPVLVLAGAGSGKTRTLTHRIAYLIAVKDVLPREILAVTFTNKAAEEMRERVNRLLRDINRPVLDNKAIVAPRIGTFHSVCAQILREDIKQLGYNSNFTIFDGADQLKAIKQVLNELKPASRDLKPKVVLSVIERAKVELIAPEDLQNEFGSTFDSPLKKNMVEAYSRYQKCLQTVNALDFSDLIFKVIELWRKDSLILQKYQNRWRYVLVDEYQDINQAQYQFCRLLAERHRNLFVVGDDYQSIYSFRGADLTNLLTFNDDYPEAKLFLLEQNYRSTKRILDLANVIIQKNREQQRKVLWTENRAGDLPKIVEMPDERAEGEYIVQEMIKRSKTPVKVVANPEELAYEYEDEWRVADINLNKNVVLYRTNAQSRALEEVMLEYGLPYRVIGGVKFYERKEIKDMIAYLRLLANPQDIISLERVINLPPRGIGPKTFQSFLLYIKSNQLDIIKGSHELIKEGKERLGYWDTRAYQKILSFSQLIGSLVKLLAKATVAEMIDFVVEESGYLDYLKQTEENFEERKENIAELKTVALRFSGALGPAGLPLFLEEVALMSEIDSLDRAQNTLTLMTVHAAKGLEFDNVFLVGMEQGLFPHYSAIENLAELEEERRLFYVGITRACQNLYLVYTRKRRLFGTIVYPEPSEFITDLKDQVAEKLII